MSHLRNISDKPRHQQLSTVKDLTFIPFGFTVSAAGAITIAENANPPQIFATAGANNQEYNLRCPAGNPKKIWAFIYAEKDIVASVTDYSTIVNGTLVIDLDTAPLSDTLMKGVLCYGRNAEEGSGVVLAVPTSDAKAPLASYGQSVAQSLLKGAMIEPVGWTVNGSNVVTETRGPLGITVSPQGSGVYHITYDHQTPFAFPENFAEIFSATDGRNVNITHTESDGDTTVIITFVNAVNMANGDRASYAAIGPVGEYVSNYGATVAGGVHNNLQTRDVHIYLNYIARVAMRESSLIPLFADIAAGTAGPTEASSNLPPGSRIVRTGVGVYDIYIGKFPEAGLIVFANLANGNKIGVSAIDGAAGTITLTTNPAADPGATGLNVLIMAKTQSED